MPHALLRPCTRFSMPPCLQVCLDEVAGEFDLLTSELEASAYPALDALAQRVSGAMPHLKPQMHYMYEECRLKVDHKYNQYPIQSRRRTV